MSNYLDQRAQGLGFKSYKEYLLSPYWKRFSKSVRRKVCYCCKTKSCCLSVHHKNYERLGNERKRDVVTVCSDCHDLIHEYVATGKTSLSGAHDYCKQIIENNDLGTRTKGRSEWVRFNKLRDREGKQTLEKLRKFMLEEGLFDGRRATPLAFQMGMVVLFRGREKWNLRGYLEFVEGGFAIDQTQDNPFSEDVESHLRSITLSGIMSK